MNSSESTEKRIKHWHWVSAYLVLYDLIAVTAAYFLALLVRFDFAYSMIPVVYLTPWKIFAPIYAVICIIVFWCFRLYNSIWRFASFVELHRIIESSFVTTVFHIIGITIVLRAHINDTGYTMDGMPISYYILGAIFQTILITAVRFAYRFVLLLRASRSKDVNNIMLVGLNSIIRTT